MDTNTILSKEMARKFAKRQRRYILAYLFIDKAKEDGSAEQSPKMSCQLVERVLKLYKKRKRCHRNILDHEKRYLGEVAKEQEERFLRGVINSMKHSHSKQAQDTRTDL